MNIDLIKATYNAKGKIGNVYRRTGKNAVMAEYYERLADETGRENFSENGKRIYFCSRSWGIDYYPAHGIKDIKRIDLCHDKFCDNCQNARSIQTERKFEPVIKRFAERYSVYSMVFTVPNPMPEDLSATISNMYKNIGYIFRLFRGNARIKGYDFRKYGFLGAIRSLEITKGRDGKTFHPHFHVLALFRRADRIEGKRVNVNQYSFHNPDVKKSHHKREAGKPERLFTDFEILLQKIWRLRIDGVRVNAKNIAALSEGYSVIAQKAGKGDYKEVFKYATKGIFKGDETAEEYADFEALALALRSRRITQGYGVFQSIDFDMYLDQENADEDADMIYSNVIAQLRKEELPQIRQESLYDVYCDSQSDGNITYISKSNVKAAANYE